MDKETNRRLEDLEEFIIHQTARAMAAEETARIALSIAAQMLEGKDQTIVIDRLREGAKTMRSVAQANPFWAARMMEIVPLVQMRMSALADAIEADLL